MAPQTFHVSVAYLSAVTDYLSLHDIDWAALIQQAGITVDILHDRQSTVPFSRYEALLDLAADIMDDNDIGLHIGEIIKPGHYGVLGYSVMSCGNLQEALQRHMRFQHLVANHGEDKVDVRGDDCHLIWGTAGQQLSRQAAEKNLSAWVNFARWISGLNATPTSVHFQHSQPSSTVEHTRIFGCPLHFEAEENKVVFPAAYLDMPLAQTDNHMRSIIDGYAEQLLNQLDSGSLIEQLKHYITEHLTDGALDLTGAAEALAMQPRTLQRKIQEHETTFSKLLDQTREQLAERYISDKSISLTEIAFLLGFSEQSSFQRAFKRWTGLTPRQYRRQNPS